MMERNFILHTKDGNKVITESEAIQNALDQERQGIEPMYSFYDYKNKKPIMIIRIKSRLLRWVGWSGLHIKTVAV